uniref:Uncharacterized protein n=1 Tax=Graphocephala atropunctata TaxID=36148 RepID=A0A1B6MK66_9HEMI
MATTHPKKKDNQELTKGQTIGGGDIVGDFVEDVWKVITPEMVERLRCVLIEDLGLSKQDADKLIQDQRNVRRQRICLKKVRIIKIGPRNQWIKELSRSIADQMALFVVGMLLSNRNARSKKITETVLEHLCELTGENATVESAKTRVERTLVVVADRMATWMDEAITDIESKIEEKYKTAASLEDLSRESLITLESSVTESEESKTSVCTEITSEIEESDIESRVTISLKSLESEEKESEESELEEESAEDKAKESREEEEKSSEEEKSEAEEQSEVEESDEEENADDGEKSEEGKTEEDEDKSEEDEEKSGVSEAEIRGESDIETTEEEAVENEEAESEEKEEDEGKVDEVSSAEEGVEDKEEEGEEEQEEEEEKEAEEEEEREKEEIEEFDITELEKESTESIVSEISIKKEKVKLPTDLLDLLKEDVATMPKADEKSNRQRAMKEVIDKRFEQIARDKLEQSLSSLVKYDIGEAASIVANWVEMILSSADEMPIEDVKPQGPAFEIKRGEGSQFQVYQVSSTTVAKKVAEVKGLEAPPRKKKLPRTMSPMNLTSSKDWADWALSAANVGEEWGKWLDSALADVEDLFSKDRALISHQDRYTAWKELKEHRGSEAKKWRMEDKKIKDEGSLWSRKLKKDHTENPESEIKTDTY